MKTDSPTFQQNIPLSPLTTIQTGGPARFFVKITDEAELIPALKEAETRCLPVHILGGGSNTIFSDSGFSGVIFKIEIEGISVVSEDDDTILIKVGAGESWDSFVEYAVSNGYSGIEALSGIPGSVGATPVQNVGAYGQEISETIDSVEALDRRSYKTHAFTVSIRRSKSMYLDSNDSNSKSCGSFFTNPIIGIEKSSQIIFNIMKALNETIDVPTYPAGNKKIKLSAAWLMEKAGFVKGFSYKDGKVGISDHHTLAIVNRSGTSRDILNFQRHIQKTIEEKFGIKLEREPIFVE